MQLYILSSKKYNYLLIKISLDAAKEISPE